MFSKHARLFNLFVFIYERPNTTVDDIYFFLWFQLPDVCYSWWVLASLKIIGRIHWIDKAKLRSFILACQDEETGGFADRPGDMVSSLWNGHIQFCICIYILHVISLGLAILYTELIILCGTFLPVLYISIQVDPFHTLFGVAGLSLLGDEQIKPVNPVFCMPEDVLQRVGLQPDLLSWVEIFLSWNPCTASRFETGKPANRGKLSSSTNDQCAV